MAKEPCEHFVGIDKDIKAKSEVCEECIKEGTHWVQLRVCLVCGHVGCCDSSVGRHATKHFQETGHAAMAAHPGREWRWCYVHKDYY